MIHRFSTTFCVLFSSIAFYMASGSEGYPFLSFLGLAPLLKAEDILRNSSESITTLKISLCCIVIFFVWNFSAVWWLSYATVSGAVGALVVNIVLMTTIFVLYHRFRSVFPRRTSYVFLVSLWMGFEYLVLHWDLQWPWLNLGNFFASTTYAVQWYEYTGVFGGTLWVWVVNILIFEYFRTYRWNWNIRALWVFAWIAIPLVASYFISRVRSEAFLSEARNSHHLRTALMLQPNLDPYTQKFQKSNQETVKDAVQMVHRALSEASMVDYILAPETFFPRYIYTDHPFEDASVVYARDSLARKYSREGLLIGLTSVTTTPFEERSPMAKKFKNREGLWYHMSNSAIYLTREDRYDMHHKSKLVVLVERFPFQSVLEPVLGGSLIDLGGVSTSFVPQDEPYPFISPVRKDTVAPVICYESVFGNYVGEYIRKGAQVIMVITNDAWWGRSDGYRQHFAFSRLRAIEHRRFVLRSANTGLSAVIDPMGRVVSKTAYGEKAALLGSFFLRSEKTFYTEQGDYIAKVALFLLTVLSLQWLLKNITKA